jgi:flagellar motility protein MotE (MotC chaperone)
MTKGIRRKKGRGALHIVAVLLMGSAALRIAAGPLPAVAEETMAESGAELSAAATDGDTDALIAAFETREARVAEREAQLRDRMQALRLAEIEIEDKMQALIAAEAALSATITQADTAAQTDLSQLTTVYENMKPKEAADLFAEMPPQFAAGFLGMMRPDAAAAIMTQLEPDVAYSFSVVLAGRNATVPTQ